MKNLYLPVLVVISMMSCKRSLDFDYIKTKTWSYEEGFKIGEGDFVLFDKKDKLFDLKQDTIFYEGVPRAIITDLNKKTYTLKVKSIDGKMTGEYRNPEESLQ